MYFNKIDLKRWEQVASHGYTWDCNWCGATSGAPCSTPEYTQDAAGCGIRWVAEQRSYEICMRSHLLRPRVE